MKILLGDLDTFHSAAQIIIVFLLRDLEQHGLEQRSLAASAK